MLAAMVDQNDLVIEILPVASPAEIAQLNQRAVDSDSGYEWREATAFERGLFVGMTLPVMGAFGGFEHERSE